MTADAPDQDQPNSCMTQTALSQEHNLYFLAFGPDIHVHRPQFPTQALPPTPF